MFFVYVLLSEKNNKKYTGFTSKDLEQRLKEHNMGSNAFTRQNRPFKILHSEKHSDENFARKRERFLKSGRGRDFIKRKYPENQ